MPNTNCLENIRCPNCGNEESFRTAARTIVTDDGTEDHGDMESDDDSHAQCLRCHTYGAVKEFRALRDLVTATRLVVPSGSLLTAGKLYLHLYHGRTEPDQHMDDWGFTGPTFGPLACVGQTYNTTIRLCGANDQELWLRHYDDMVIWEGVYFGDMSIFIATGNEHG